MQLIDLINHTRLGCENSPVDENLNARSEFKRDFDRIIFSPAFRRLQGKTQIFPFPHNDHTHNRLTHSLEVFCLGRTLGTIAANKIEKSLASDIGDIVGAASLAHDIGNPPFGHSGEEAFSNYFKELDPKLMNFLPDEMQRTDLTNFEGNAIGFRVLTHSKPLFKKDKGGYGLTYSTLASYLKYPTNSSSIKKKYEKSASLKKNSFLSPELPLVKKILNDFKVKERKEKNSWYRFPLAFLVEAADDIAYHIIDLEDGYRNKLISYSDVENYLKKLIGKLEKKDSKVFSNITDKSQKIAFLRSKAINSILLEVSEIFFKKWDSIANYDYDNQLIREIPKASVLEDIYDFSSEHLYNSKAVVQVELAGYKIIFDLLDIFIDSFLLNPNSHFSKKVKRLIPEEYFIISKGKLKNEKYTGFELILNICEYIFGMTDNFALHLYRKLKGIELPEFN